MSANELEALRSRRTSIATRLERPRTGAIHPPHNRRQGKSRPHYYEYSAKPSRVGRGPSYGPKWLNQLSIRELINQFDKKIHYQLIDNKNISHILFNYSPIELRGFHP